MVSSNQQLGYGTFGQLGRFFHRQRDGLHARSSGRAEKIAESMAPSAIRLGWFLPYCFFAGFFFGAGFAVFLISLSRPPMRLIASAALNGNCRTDVSV